MKIKSISSLILFLLFLIPFVSEAQIEKVIVETYYVSDTNDATDTIGGKLEAGSKTYRIYVDMKKGSKLKKLYGDHNHALKFSSTENFFNNKDRGQTFAKNFSKSHLGQNTVALDSWLTLGQITKTAAKSYFGILKSDDTDGSIIGGTKNDGGSAEIASGLLTNTDASAGIPLTLQDGFSQSTSAPTDWADYGFVDYLSGNDSTIFGSLISRKQFISHNAGLQNSGVTGLSEKSNMVLIGQLTTKGELSFELNLEIIDSIGTTTKYVANDSILSSGEKLERYLKFPFIEECGCPDKEYLEYKKDRDCDDQGACKSKIVFGCMDPISCNYNPKANFNLPELCCYPGYCNDRDLSLVCPAIGNETASTIGFSVYPNPAQSQLTLEVESPENKEASYAIYDSFGTSVVQKSSNTFSDSVSQLIDLSRLPNGLYLIRLFREDKIASKRFMKQ